MKRRPFGISIISIVLWCAAVAEILHALVGPAARWVILGRLFLACVFGGIGIGLWLRRNLARTILIVLLVVHLAASLITLLVFAIPKRDVGLILSAVGQLLVLLLVLWYIDRPKVRLAFGGVQAWPKAVRALVLSIFVVLLAFPFYWMVIATFKQNIDLYNAESNPFIFNLKPTLEHLRLLFYETGYVRWLWNTARVGTLVVIITLLLAVPAAYALARLTGRWGQRLGILIFLTYLVPSTLLFIPLSRVVAILGLQDTIWALVLVYPSFTVPFSIWLLMAFFKSIPKELEDAAMVDGLTRFGAFVKLVIPISISGILTVVIFTFTLVTQEFVYALTFISPESQQMVGVGIPIFLVRGDVYFWGSLMAACLIASLPIAFLYNLFLDRFIAGFTVGAVKG
jgi:multiple sugar transport system permease protein